MPSIYAHLRFGEDVLSRIPGKNSRLAGRFRQLYDVGLQGPDPFFYYNPLFHTATGQLGKKLHRQSGIVFFGNVVCELRKAEGFTCVRRFKHRKLCGNSVMT